MLTNSPHSSKGGHLLHIHLVPCSVLGSAHRDGGDKILPCSYSQPAGSGNQRVESYTTK